MILIGIDPGLSGAVAAIDTLTNTPQVHDLPTREIGAVGLVKRRIDGKALIQLLRHLMPANRACIVTLERIEARGGNSAQTMGSLMRTVGAIEAALDITGWRVEQVRPQAWKGSFGLGADKYASLIKARAMFPALADVELKLARQHNRAEALLLAHYGSIYS